MPILILKITFSAYNVKHVINISSIFKKIKLFLIKMKRVILFLASLYSVWTNVDSYTAVSESVFVMIACTM